MFNIWNIFRKEVASFFNSLIGYIVMAVFLLGVGIFFWAFGNNVLDSGLANMDDLFVFAPWFFLFLIPAITMRSFSEEISSGTIELLATKPVTDWQILWGKYLAACFLVVFCLLPTLIYYFTLQDIGLPPGNLDTGPIWGAYIGLTCLGFIFVALGIFSSTLVNNQIVALIISVTLCFFFYAAFDFIAEIEALRGINDIVLKIGINEHYRSISEGVVDTRDIVYFISFVVITLIAAKIMLTNKKR